MDHIFQCAVFLFLYHIQGSSAEKSLFVKKGSDVQLDVQKAVPEEFTYIEWNFNEKNNLVFFQRGGEPTLKTVEFSKTNYTLKLKNVQEKDSGDYAAVVLVGQKEIVAEYKVTVQAPVSLVNLTVDSVSSSSVSCNLTVTCRTQDSHIRTTFTCVNQTCSEDGDRAKATTSGPSFHIYIENDSIKCNHSNQVSWTTIQGAKIQDFCPQKPSPTSTAGVVAGSVAGILLALVVTIGIFILCKKIKDKKKSNGNTVYDVPQNINSTRTQTQDLKSTYALVQFHKGPEHSTNIVNTPETIYAQVMKPGKSKSTSLESPTSDLYST